MYQVYKIIKIILKGTHLAVSGDVLRVLLAELLDGGNNRRVAALQCTNDDGRKGEISK